jgi:sugar fermentation stimulation protein A
MIPRRGVKRKTPYDMVAILHHDFWVSIDSRVPNILMRDAIEQGMIDQFRGYEKIVPEYRLGDSRFDFLLMNSGKCLLEVKSCTLVKRGTALFPDAPTTRGRRHLEELITAKYRGYRSCIAFVVQREDARCFAPNREIDEAFADALMAARAAGVEVFAFSCVLSRRGIELDGQLPVMV